MIQSHLDTMLVYLMMLMLQGDDPNRVTTDSGNNLGGSSTYKKNKRGISWSICFTGLRSPRIAHEKDDRKRLICASGYDEDV